MTNFYANVEQEITDFIHRCNGKYSFEQDYFDRLEGAIHRFGIHAKDRKLRDIVVTFDYNGRYTSLESREACITD
jgi:hypothetical protein